MSSFTAADWATLAAVHDLFLTDTCVITPSVAGTDPIVITTVNCAVIDGNGIGGGGDQLMRDVDRLVMLPTGTTVKANDRIEWTGQNGTLTLEVSEAKPGRTDETGMYVPCIKVPT